MLRRWGSQGGSEKGGDPGGVDPAHESRKEFWEELGEGGGLIANKYRAGTTQTFIYLKRHDC